MATDTAGQPNPDPAPSLEERLGALMGAPPDPTDEEEGEGQPDGAATEEPPADTFELEVEGEKFVLPKKLEKGFMQEKDYTQKSMSLADQRRALDAHNEQLKLLNAEGQFRAQVAPELQQLGMLETLIKQAQSLDWQSMPTEELMRKRIELDGLKEQRDELSQKVRAKQADWGQQQATSLNELKAKSLKIVKEMIPGWSDETAKAVKEHALSQGFTESELANIFDPRHAVTLWKASQYDALKAKAQPAVKDAKNVKTGSSNPMPAQVKEKLAFQKALKSTQEGTPERKRAVEDRIAAKFGG